MAFRGGAREGAGRPKGKLNNRTKVLMERAAVAGIMPIEVLLNDMRYFYNLGERQLADVAIYADISAQEAAFKTALGLKALARECAIQAAPYVHPKLASIQANVTVSNHETALAELE